MSLIELMAVLLIGSLLMTMVFVVYTNSSKSLLRQEVVLQQLMNLRSGMAAMSREVRSSGNGFFLLGLMQYDTILIFERDAAGEPSGWFSYDPANPGDPPVGIRAIHSIARDDAPDEVTVCSLTPDYAAPLGVLGSDYAGGNGRIELSSVLDVPASLAGEILRPGDLLAIVPTDPTVNLPVIVEAASDATDLTSIDVKAPSFSGLAFSRISQGALVYNVKDVRVRTFKVKSLPGDTSCPDVPLNSLMMETLDSTCEILAEGIEDLQVGFYFGKEHVEADLTVWPGTIQNSILMTKWRTDYPIKAVRLAIVSRTATEDPYSKGFRKLSILDHERSAEPPDGYPRRLLDTIVQLRNY
jgi:type II secretory pathway pseudopilin PulG